MTATLRLAILLVVSLMGFATSIPANDTSTERIEKARLEELKRTAERIREIILRKDVSGFLEYVRPEHDDFTYEAVRRELQDPTSWLYGNLFSSEVLKRHAKKSPRHPISVRDYFLRAKDAKILVGFYEDKEQKKLDWGWLMFRSSNFPRKQWPLATFFYIRGKWWITDMFEHEP